jgi:hypothetical protein
MREPRRPPVMSGAINATRIHVHDVAYTKFGSDPLDLGTGERPSGRETAIKVNPVYLESSCVEQMLNGLRTEIKQVPRRSHEAPSVQVVARQRPFYVSG